MTDLTDIAKTSIDKMLTKKEEGIVKFLETDGPKNISQVIISQKDNTPKTETDISTDSIPTPFDDAAEIKRRMRNPYVYHPDVIEIKTALLQEEAKLAMDTVITDHFRSYTTSLYEEKTKANTVTKAKIKLLKDKLQEYRIYCTHKKIDNISAIHLGHCMVCGLEIKLEEPNDEQLDLENLLAEQIKDGKGVSGELIKEVLKLNSHYILPENIVVHGELALYDIHKCVFLPDGMTVHGYMNLQSMKIIKLPNRLKVVNNSLCINNTYITHLPDDLEVDDTIYASGSAIPKELKEKYKQKHKIQ